MRARLLWLLVWTVIYSLATGVEGHGSTVEVVDLNTASFAQLRALPGMGDEYVRRVLTGRPYSAKNQLVTRGVLPQGEYERIGSLVVAHRVKKTVDSSEKDRKSLGTNQVVGRAKN